MATNASLKGTFEDVIKRTLMPARISPAVINVITSMYYDKRKIREENVKKSLEVEASGDTSSRSGAGSPQSSMDNPPTLTTLCSQTDSEERPKA